MNFTKIIKKFINRRFYTEIWHVGVFKGDITEILSNDFLENKKISWIPNPKSFSYFADPFFLDVKSSELNLLAEYFDYRNKIGEIWQLNLDKDCQLQSTKKIIVDKFHHSYPAIFENENKKYLLPESSAASNLSLFEFDKKLETLQKLTNLFDETILIDATILKYQNLFYLFFNSKTPHHKNNSILNIAYSEQIESNWLMHSANPVKIDTANARPAGNFFVIEDKLYRPAQDCALSYGAAIIINQVIKLNKDEYIEEFITRINLPESFPYQDGIHTINYKNGYFVIDCRENFFSPFKIFIVWQRRLTRLLAKIKKRL